MRHPDEGLADAARAASERYGRAALDRLDLQRERDSLLSAMHDDVAVLSPLPPTMTIIIDLPNDAM